MTGYHMTLGYMPHLKGGDEALEKCWRKFKRVVAKLREQSPLIMDELMRTKSVHWDKPQYADAYSIHKEEEGVNHIIHIDEEQKQIWLAAAGGELVVHRFRRAFCRLVIREMNKHDIAINLNIV